MKIYVVDTNIILQDVNNILKLSNNGNNIIVIPETVLIEVEDKKKLFDEVGYQAREFARFLANGELIDTYKNDVFKVVKLKIDNFDIHLVSKYKYDTKLEINSISESNDKRIIEIAKIVDESYQEDVIFVSLDVYARMFAALENIKTESLKNDKSELPKFNFYKSIMVHSNEFATIDYKDIKIFDKDYKPNNFCYEFKSPDGHRIYSIIHNEKIYVLDDDEINTLKVKPVNLEQKFFTKAILSNLFNIIMTDAKAGSGKTLMVFVAAMKLIDQGLYDKIVYVRNSIESLDKGADVGYLSGNEEKFRIYNLAMYDTLEFIAKSVLKKKDKKIRQKHIEAKIEEFIVRYNIEKFWPGEARGRTLSSSIVILDEWQNSSNKTTQLILSRLDNSCMAIVIGSNRQIDNLYLNKYNNGLTTLLKQTFNKQEDISLFAIELQKAVRGKFANFSENVFENIK